MFWLVSIACVGGCLFNFKYRGLRGFAMVPGASFALHASHQVEPPSPSLCTFLSPFPIPNLARDALGDPRASMVMVMLTLLPSRCKGAPLRTHAF
jgi:hypothetical protein